MARKEKKDAAAAPEKRKKKKRGKAAPPPEAPQKPAAATPTQQRRASGGVPPLDAFDNLHRLPPPLSMQEELGAEEPPQAPAAKRKGAKGPRKKAAPKKEATPGQAGRPPAAAKRQAEGQPERPPKPQKAVNPARRRRRRQIATLLAVIVLIAAGVWFSVSVLFKIDKFEIQGECPYTLQELEAVFGHAPGDNMYGFSVQNAEERMEQNLPYIEQVVIRRRLPSTIIFRVTPAVETFYIPYAGGFAILSDSRKVLAEVTEEPTHLTRIDGLSGLVVVPGQPLALSEEAKKEAASLAAQQSSAAQSDPEDSSAASDEGGEVEVPQVAVATAGECYDVLLLLLDELATSGLTDIDWIDVSDPLNIQFSWEGRVTVKMGPKGGLAEKMRTTVVLLTDVEQGLVLPGDRGVLDMTYYLDTGRAYFAPE